MHVGAVCIDTTWSETKRLGDLYKKIVERWKEKKRHSGLVINRQC